MLILQGKYNQAKVFTNNIEPEACKQVIDLCNQDFAKDSKIRIMPDVHAGKGCTIGTTMTIHDKVVPNLVGVDIGCGMHVVILKDNKIDFEKLDKFIYANIPSGHDIRKKEHPYISLAKLSELKCKHHIDIARAELSLGTCGGGNHFIECNKSVSGEYYLVVHSGSRHLGKQVAEHYQNIAFNNLSSVSKEEKKKLIDEVKSQGRHKEIETELKKLRPRINKDMAYLEGDYFNAYIHDMKIVQNYAFLNRKAIVDEIIENIGLTPIEEFTTIHNYIDMENMILRKGAVSAQKGEKIIIPINMRDGCIIAIGKGNPDWNYSAPHGAGRLYPRSKCRELISLDSFKESMKGIYSTSIGNETLDEAPEAYKPMHEILENIKDTVEIVEIIKPVYNFKHSKPVN